MGASGSATTGEMTQTQQDALWRTLARDTALAAMAFSPEASAAMSAVCACVAAGESEAGKEVLQNLWTELNDMEAAAVVRMINDVVTLSGVDVSADAARYMDILKAMCEVVR